MMVNYPDGCLWVLMGRKELVMANGEKAEELLGELAKEYEGRGEH